MKTNLLFVFSIFATIVFAQKTDLTTINQVLISESYAVHKPLFADIKSVKDQLFSDEDLLKNKYLSSLDIRPKEGEEFVFLNDQTSTWETLKANSTNEFKLKKTESEFEIQYISFYVENSEWADIELTVKTGRMLELYLDGEFQKGKYSNEIKGEEKEFRSELMIDANNHALIFKVLGQKNKKESNLFKIELKQKNKQNNLKLISSIDPHEYMDIDHLMNGVNYQNVNVSPKGDFYLLKYQRTFGENKKQEITEIRKLADNRLIQIFYGSEVWSFSWVPNSNSISYVSKIGNEYFIWKLNPDDGTIEKIAGNLKDVSNYSWSPNAQYMVITKYEEPTNDGNGLKQINGMPDHWPWYRTRGNLYIYDIVSKVEIPLTHGYLSNNLNDISPDGRYILFSQGIYDESRRPYSKQILLKYDLANASLDTIWNKFGSGQVSFSPNGNQLLVLAGPVFFGDIGKNLNDSLIPNDYDTQAYIYALESGEVKAISKNFNPNILDAFWSKSNSNEIYFRVSDRTYNSVYKYSLYTNQYSKLELNMDVVDKMSFSNENNLMLFTGSSISTPEKLFSTNLITNEIQLLDDPEADFFEDVKFGKNEDWNFQNKNGVTIEGRIYYPPQFDSTKKYPMIVYYYGGTSPTERDFRGRYPKNLFAANGYIVYVLQPSGATGYGQEFSAQHVNNWGKTVADEIIMGAKGMCQNHSFIDSTKVGIIGASYGGFMTMYLTTQTDYFSAAISHAGISSISSYWGEGYWGYLYSQVASAESFPWNNKELYVEQSPLFHADKVKTPILLLHGNSDTNVPPGESRQFYTALKLLQKDVELIEIDKQDHHIKDYQKRILWQKTILAYFDKYLKNQPDWWNHLYPKKNL